MTSRPVLSVNDLHILREIIVEPTFVVAAEEKLVRWRRAVDAEWLIFTRFCNNAKLVSLFGPFALLQSFSYNLFSCLSPFSCKNIIERLASTRSSFSVSQSRDIVLGFMVVLSGSAVKKWIIYGTKAVGLRRRILSKFRKLSRVPVHGERHLKVFTSGLLSTVGETSAQVCRWNVLPFKDVNKKAGNMTIQGSHARARIASNLCIYIKHGSSSNIHLERSSAK